MEAEDLANFAAPVVRQPIRRFKRNIYPGDFSVFCDEERLGPAEIRGALLPNFADADHFHECCLNWNLITAGRYVNNCVHIRLA